MKKSFLYSTLLAVVLFSMPLIMSSCGGGKTETQEQTTEEAAPAEMAEAKYACPMHPEETGKKGDVCSKCNMALEEVKDGADTTEMHDHH